jgi:hypothetical protein
MANPIEAALTTGGTRVSVQVLARARLKSGRVAMLLLCQGCREVFSGFFGEAPAHRCTTIPARR